jgi:hypothetical protein
LPLKSGSSDAVIEQNIKELIAAGHPPDQAAAIAHDKAGRMMSSPAHQPNHIPMPQARPPRDLSRWFSEP